jgi:predicted RND superfamily exporter protein
VQYYADVRDQFGSGDIAVVGVRAPHVFNVPTLTKIARVTDRLAALDGVEQVVSLTTPSIPLPTFSLPRSSYRTSHRPPKTSRR